MSLVRMPNGNCYKPVKIEHSVMTREKIDQHEYKIIIGIDDAEREAEDCGQVFCGKARVEKANLEDDR